MKELIITWGLAVIWGLLLLSVVVRYVVSELNFRRQLNKLNEKHHKESMKIDELEKRILMKQRNHE